MKLARHCRKVVARVKSKLCSV